MKDYPRGFQNSLLKCVSNPTYKYRDCTKAINHWVPGACPVQCIRDAAAPGCARVKSCVRSGFYVGIGDDSSDLATLNEQMTTLTSGQILYRIRTKATFRASYFTLAFYRNVEHLQL